jgi:hypothetical protein
MNVDGRLFASVRFRRVSLEVGAEATLPSSGWLDDRSGFRYRTDAGTLALCGHLGWWAACGVGEIAKIYVQGFGVPQPLSSSGVQPSAGARLALTHRLWGRLAASVQAEWLKSLASWTVELDHTKTWTTPAWGIHFGLDVGATFD